MEKVNLTKEAKKHLNDIIVGIDEECLKMTYDQKIKRLLEIFKDETQCNYNIKKGVKNTFIYWLGGLPSSINVLYTSYDIKLYFENLGLDDLNLNYEIYYLYLYEAINADYDILSYYIDALELENTKRNINGGTKKC